MYCYSDSPLDLKIKGNMLCDLFSLTGESSRFGAFIAPYKKLFTIPASLHCDGRNMCILDSCFFLMCTNRQNWSFVILRQTKTFGCDVRWPLVCSHIMLCGSNYFTFRAKLEWKFTFIIYINDIKCLSARHHYKPCGEHVLELYVLEFGVKVSAGELLSNILW